jgi:hypothetical protein
VSSERTTWRRCASLSWVLWGPEGPVTWLPTLNRGREGLQSQGLMRVVTDTPVTTRAVAKATRESGGERSLRLPHRPRVTLRRISRGGSREVRRTTAGLGGPAGRISPGRRSSRRPVAPWKLRWRPTYARSGSSGDIRSLFDRPRSRQAITRPELLVPLQAPWVARGLSFKCAYRARRPGISTRGPRRASHRSPPAARSGALRIPRQATTAAGSLKRGKVAV